MDVYYKRFCSNPHYELEAQYTGKVSKTAFVRLLAGLKRSSKFTFLEEANEKLSISFTSSGMPLRYEIAGAEDIRSFLTNERLNPVSPPDLVHKAPVEDAPPISVGHGFQLVLKIEKPTAREHKLPTKRYFRLKRRTSYATKDGLFRIDVTAVRSGESAEKLDGTGEKYEIEIEVMHTTCQESIKKEMTNIIRLIKEMMDKPKHRVTFGGATEWVLPNRAGFLPWAYQKFHPDQYAAPVVAAADDTLNLFPHQQLVRDYMQYESPYRGLLLYHGLGVGKSCASIAAAEGFLDRSKRIFIMVPASLEPNYRTEISRCATLGNPRNKIWSKLELGTSKALVEKISEQFGLDVKFATKHRKDLWVTGPVPADVEKYVTKKALGWRDMNDADKQGAGATLTHIVDRRYTFIRYNGVTKKIIDDLGARPFDDAFVVIDEAHNFISRVVNGSVLAKRLYNMLIGARGLKIVLLSGTPIINHPFELCVMLNLVRGPMPQYEFGLLKGATIPSVSDVKAALGIGASIVDSVLVKAEERKILISPLPFGYVHAAGEDEAKIIAGAWPVAGMEEVPAYLYELLAKRIKVGKRVGTEEIAALPSRKDEFGALFLDETDVDKPRVMNSDLFMRRVLGTVSYFRTAGEAFFPTVLPRRIEKIPMTDFQFSRYVQTRDKERSREQGKVSVMGKKGTVYRAFSRMCCNFVFPDGIKREFPKDIRRALMSEIAIEEDDEDKADAAAAAKAASNEAKRKYDAMLTRVMHELRETGDEVLSKKKLQDIHSPKFAKIVEHIDTSPGTVLLYSQFRTVEGLGIIRLALEQAGFAELDVHREDGAWEIRDAERVLAPEYDGRRFVVFNEDREKTNMLLRIFNGQFGDLPESLARHFAGRNNLYGAITRVMMITQSGAEGISLRNVRRVLITEPFWNMVRMDQIIGRAVRTGSHADLPPAERDVQVFIYTAAFTKEQLKSNFTLQRRDGSMTSDQHILDVATRKDEIIRHFLGMLKAAAVDCLSNASANMPVQNGFKCYAFPVGLEDDAFAYLPDITEDREMKGRFSGRVEKKQVLKGRVVSRDGVKHVLVDGRPGLWDYRAWKDAGVLIPSSTYQ
jgi:hypothetical protein